MSRSLFILILSLALGLLAGVAGACLYGPAEGAAKLGFAGGVLAEFLLLGGLLALPLSGRLPLRAIAYLALTLALLVYGAQLAALYLTGDYLTPTALANTRHIGLVLNPLRTACAVAFILGVPGLIALIEFRFGATRPAIAVRLALGGLAAAALLYLAAGAVAAPDAPGAAFVRSAASAGRSAPERHRLDPAERALAADFGMAIRDGAPYPLVRDGFYRSALPFGEHSGTRSGNPSGAPPNLIVLMFEGISARLVQPYSERYPGLTPNFAAFASEAMRVDNYYGHTFATYRGLQGQFCSLFPLHAGGQIFEDTDYYCLADLLNEEGYDTHFLFSQQSENTALDELLLKTGFDRVLAQNDLRQAYLNGAEPRRPLALSDQQFIDAFIGHLQMLERQQGAGGGAPFFVGIYNIETHAYYEMAEDGQAYDGADDYILDAIHNLDAAFGRFWQYFRQSGLYGNTVVVLTTDHAAFQGKDFASLVTDQADYQPIFVDRIPLLIHHPGLDLSPAWDARQASSIDLAPTLAHLLQLDNRPNPFLGRSIFERERERDRGLAFGEDHVYLIEPGGIRYQAGYRAPPEGDALLNRLHGIVSYTQACESEGKIWNAEFEER